MLGFATHHAYVFDDLADQSKLPISLKGADRVVYMSALSLRVPVMVVPKLTNSYI